jgi:SAM-dependent methyltransferase
MHPQQLWEESAPAWIALMERGDLNRTLLLDPVMLRLAGDVQGRRVCDVGSGEGRFCRMLAQRSANVVGLEPTQNLVEEARRLDPKGRYIEAGGESIPLASESFDLVICYLVLIDIPDYRRAISEMARITKPGGRILVANINSFCTTRPRAWIRDNEVAQHIAVDNYFEERSDVLEWSGIKIRNYHRPFEAYMQAFLSQPLRLISFVEPTTESDASPNMELAKRVPYFHVMEWRKD